MTEWLLGVVLGVIQGISEWLPISSKTQIIIASHFLLPSLDVKAAYAFGLFLEGGTFIVAVSYFRREVWSVLKALVGKGDEDGRMLLKYLVIATAVTAVVGVAIYKTALDSLSGPVVGIPMILLGCVLLGDAAIIKLARGRFTPRKTMKQLTVLDLVIIGLAQGIAALPGVSRSGVTVSAMLLLGVKPSESFKLSFLMLIPASIGATAVTVLFSDAQISTVLTTVTWPVILTAIAVTVLIGLGFIRVLLKAAASDKIVLLTLSLGILAVVSGASGLLWPGAYAS